MALLNINIILPHIRITTAAVFAVFLNVELRVVFLYEEGFSFIELFLVGGRQLLQDDIGNRGIMAVYSRCDIIIFAVRVAFQWLL